MTETIPTDWEMRTIGDLIEESRIPATISSLSKRLTVRLHLKGVEQRQDRATDIDGTTKYFVRKSGQFIYGKQNLHKGAIGLVPHLYDGFFSTQDIPCFDFHSDCDPNWFLNIFSQKHFYESLENIAAGTGSVRIHPNELFKVPIPVPPLVEQKKIADILTSVDDTIEHTQAQVVKLQDLKTATMNELLTRGIGHTEFRESELGLIPTDWEIKKAGAFLEQSKASGKEELPIYSVSIKDGLVPRSSQDRIIHSQLKDEKNLFVSKDQFCYNMMRMWQGASGIAPEDCLVSPAYVVCEINRNLVSPKFLSFLFKIESSLRKFTTYSTGVASDRWRLYFDQLQVIKFALPPLGEQKKIADILTWLDDQIESVELKLVQLESLKKSLMGDLLTGRVRVSVD